MSRPRADTRLSDLPNDVDFSDDDVPREPFSFPDEIHDTLIYINEIVAERQQTYNLLKAELKAANTKKLYESCLKQQREQIAAGCRNTISESLISEIVRATAGGELAEQNNIRFWALCMKKNASGEYKKMVNVPERPSGLSDAGKVVMWKTCRELKEYGPLRGKIEMPDKPDGIEEDTEEDTEEDVGDDRRRTVMMDGEWHQAIIHERHERLVGSLIAELDVGALDDEREEGLNTDSITDRPRLSINLPSRWQSFYSDPEEPTNAEEERAYNRSSWNEGHELR